jgi:hypothetical protein
LSQVGERDIRAGKVKTLADAQAYLLRQVLRSAKEG